MDLDVKKNVFARSEINLSFRKTSLSSVGMGVPMKIPYGVKVLLTAGPHSRRRGALSTAAGCCHVSEASVLRGPAASISL